MVHYTKLYGSASVCPHGPNILTEAYLYIKKCTGRIAPNRLEAHGVNRDSTEVCRPLMVVIIVVFSERGAAGKKIIGRWG